MKRRVFDVIVSFTGVGLAVVLLIAGGLLTWANHFTDNEVHNQLAAQQIQFPAANSSSIKELPPADAAAMRKYAGQQLTTGAQAETWADHFIAVHVAKMSGGKTYDQLSSESLADPGNTQLAGLVDTVFKGEALRGMLLNAYAFGTLGTIAGIASWIAYAAGVLLLALGGLGLWHSRRVPDSEEVLEHHQHPAKI